MARTSLCRPAEHHCSRRQVLAAMAGCAGVSAFGNFVAAAAAQAATATAKQVLFVWLDGGMSQLESWDPKPNTEFGGPFRAISTSVPGIQICELLPRTAQQMQHLVVVRNLCTKDNAHSSGVARIQRGDPKNRGVTYPYFGSAVAKLLGPGDSGLPPYVWIKPGSGGFMHQDAGFLGPQYGALAFGDGRPPDNLLRPATISSEEDAARHALREAANARYLAQHRPAAGTAQSYVFDTGRQLLKRQDLFDSATFAPRDVERYGTHEIGRHLLQARKMLEAGVRFVKVASYGWDTHGDNFNGHSSLVGRFDQGFAAIVEDLAASGQLKETLVIAMSEFGRTPRINGHVGRDHWPEAWSIAMAGGGLPAGVTLGQTNAAGTFVDGTAYDVGHLFHTWYQLLGIDPDLIQYDNAGQPLPIAHDDMGPIKELLPS